MLHMLQRNYRSAIFFNKEVQMKKFFLQWIHYAALATEAFAGQAHLYNAANDDEGAVAREKAPEAREAKEFAPVLQAAD
jgi:hypothetical protein